jgi:hypothetical protein
MNNFSDKKGTSMSGQRNTMSDVARLLAQIQAEYESAVHGLSGVACGTATHQFITARMERMGNLHRELEHLIGEEEAIGLFVQTLEDGGAKGDRD